MISGGLLTAPLAAQPQQAKKVYRVGLIFTTSPVSEMAGPEPIHPLARAFLQGLRALGYVEGQNLILERRSAEGRFERFGEIARELVGLKADVIVTVTDPMARAAKAVTTTVPIVIATSGDPVSGGLVQSLARPGGNITGLTVVVGPEIEAKRLELLREMLPGVSRVVYLGSTEDKDWERSWGKSVRTAAQALGVTLVLAEFTPHQYTDAFALIDSERLVERRAAPQPRSRHHRPGPVSPLAEGAGFKILTHGQVPLVARSRLQMGTGRSTGLRPLGEAPFVTFARPESLARGARPASYIRIPWRPELASLTASLRSSAITV